MDKEYIFVLIVTAIIYFCVFEANANETVTILAPDGSIQICSVTESGVIVCL